jgi:hypothetical protein
MKLTFHVQVVQKSIKDNFLISSQCPSHLRYYCVFVHKQCKFINCVCFRSICFLFLALVVPYSCYYKVVILSDWLPKCSGSGFLIFF